MYEGLKCEYETEGLANEEDVQYYFRVAAVNDVGIGPYSVSVCYTKEKACELYIGLVSQARPSRGKRGSGDTELCRMSTVFCGHISGC